MTDVLGSDSSALQLRVLGPLVALREGRQLSLGGLRQRAVLGRLICSSGRVVTVDQLAAAVWGESRPSGYVSTLQTYVFHLRAALDPNRSARRASTVLRTEAGGYRLDLDANGATLDAGQFDALFAAGRARLAAGDPVEAASLLNAAIDLWHGDVMADLRDFEFVQPYADRLTQQLVDAQECSFDAELVLGNHAGIVDAISAAIAAHPLRERLHAQRMLALYRCGRQAEALASYTSLRDMLVDELAIEPNQQIQDLHRQILEQDPALDWQQIDPPQASIAVSSTQQSRVQRRSGGGRAREDSV